MLLPLLMNNLMGSGVGPVLVIVPNVVGESQSQGTIDLQAVLFTVSVSNAYSNTVPIGDIISQDPAAGTSQPQSSNVNIVVSLGPPVIPPSSGTSRRRTILTANDLILSALKKINSYAPGESLSQDDAQDALDTLNDMLDSWSTDNSSIYCTVENILQFVPGQYQYTIGNPFSENTFTGTLVSGSNVISNVTIPSDVVVNGDLYVDGIGVQAGTTITAFGGTTVMMSQVATATVSTPQVFSYTVPGDFKVDRPLRIHNSFTRINTSGTSGLDYPIEVVDREQYIQIGYKGIACPWPIAVWYNPCMPLGMLNFYQNPSGAGELHLFTDTILTRLETLTQPVVLPQGYVRWIKWALAKELAPEYGKAWTQTMESNWKEALDCVKALNATPTPVSDYDQTLTQPRYDAGWILNGGFR